MSHPTNTIIEEWCAETIEIACDANHYSINKVREGEWTDRDFIMVQFVNGKAELVQ